MPLGEQHVQLAVTLKQQAEWCATQMPVLPYIHLGITGHSLEHISQQGETGVEMDRKKQGGDRTWAGEVAG